MKTEFNVERVCDRVHLCIVDAPDELGAAKIEVLNGSIHVSFPGAVNFTDDSGSEVFAHPEQPIQSGQPLAATFDPAAPGLVSLKVTKRRGKNAQG